MVSINHKDPTRLISVLSGFYLPYLDTTNQNYLEVRKMIPDIGIMVGLYIITRCGNMIGKKESVVLSCITIAVTIACVLDLIGKGVK